MVPSIFAILKTVFIFFYLVYILPSYEVQIPNYRKFIQICTTAAVLSTENVSTIALNHFIPKHWDFISILSQSIATFFSL